jgi:hypothetical protein
MAKRRTYQGKSLRSRRTGQSPYQAHAKREYLYSTAYQNWAVVYRPKKDSQKE